MTSEDRRQSIDDLIEYVRARVMEKVDAMPDEWDDVELRRYLADQFELCTGILRRGYIRSHGQSKRLKAFNDMVVERDL
jgi:hypothetical protein